MIIQEIRYEVSEFIIDDYYDGQEWQLEGALNCTFKIYINEECWFDTIGFCALEFVSYYKKWKNNTDEDFLYYAIDHGDDPLISFSSFNGALKCCSPWQLFEISGTIDRENFVLNTDELIQRIREHIFLDLKIDIASYLHNRERIYI